MPHNQFSAEKRAGGAGKAQPARAPREASRCIVPPPPRGPPFWTACSQVNDGPSRSVAVTSTAPRVEAISPVYLDVPHNGAQYVGVHTFQATHGAPEGLLAGRSGIHYDQNPVALRGQYKRIRHHR